MLPTLRAGVHGAHHRGNCPDNCQSVPVLMAIYLDAEVLYGLSLRSLEWSSLRAIAQGHRLELAIPELALREATANWRDQVTAKAADIRRAIDRAEGFFELPHFRAPDSQWVADKWRTELLSGARVIEATPEHASQALDRELQRIAPSRDGRGARDAAIWLAIRDDHLSRSEPGYFVSGNYKDFGEPPNGELHSVLRAEVAGSQPFTCVHEISALLPLLAEVGGRAFTVRELDSSPDLKVMMRNRLDDAIGFALIDRLVKSAFGAPLRWSGTRTSVREPTVWKISHQTVYQLPAGQQVAVLRTSWVAFVDIGLSGPRQLVEAGFREGIGALVVEADLWARRDPQTSGVDFAFSGIDKIDVAVDASDILLPPPESALDRPDTFTRM